MFGTSFGNKILKVQFVSVFSMDDCCVCVPSSNYTNVLVLTGFRAS